MPWPKGKPRKGHINADGTPHAKKGAKFVVSSVAQTDFRVIQPVVGSTEKARKALDGVRIRRISPDALDMTPAPSVKNPDIKGLGTRPCIEQCPNPKCGYAYADGGYCEECGWTRPVVMGRVS